MRVGCYDLEWEPEPRFTAAEALSGRARLLRTAVCADGENTGSVNVSLRIAGEPWRRKRARCRSGDEILGAVTLPPGIAPGAYEALLTFAANGKLTERRVAFRVYPADVVPTAPERASYLAAWMDEDPELRSFAVSTIRDADGAEARLRALYEALRALKLPFYSVPGPSIPGCERVSPRRYTLVHGGNSMELSLLLASLIRLAGGMPALLLLPGHVMAGCFLKNPPFITDTDAGNVLARVRRGEWIPLDTACVCKGENGADFPAACRAAEKELAKGGPCVLVHVVAALRSGVPTVAQPMGRVCPVCGYDDIALMREADEYGCPACGAALHSPEPAPVAQAVPVWLNFTPCGNGYAVTGASARAPREIRIPEYRMGKPVVKIAARAFMGADISSVILPDSVTEIGEEAFRDCVSLETAVLPDRLTTLGSRAFCSSGLKEIELPDTLRRIPFAAFFNCRALERAELPECLTRVEAQAFGQCPRLKRAGLPNTAVSVDGSAFDRGCVLFEQS